MPQLSKEAFLAWAAQVGIDASPEHLDSLHAEVGALLTRIEPLADIDITEVPPDVANRPTRDDHDNRHQ